MAYLTGSRRVYLFVSEEENQTSIQASEHSVEQGESLTDHVRPDAETISVSGVISGRNHKSIVSLIKGWEKSGKAVRYSGRTKLTQCLISDFSPSYSKDIENGCGFSMTLRKVRVAKPAYVAPETTQATETKPLADAGMQSVEVNNQQDQYHAVKAGDTVWSLVNGPYKKYGKSCEEIMAMNPDAFSRPGDFSTLKVGARLKMG